MSARRKKSAELKDEASRFAPEALEVLAKLMRESGSDQVKVAAARELLDRAHGKPKAEGGAGGPGLAELIEAANLLDEDL
jgi:hypothetical protein